MLPRHILTCTGAQVACNSACNLIMSTGFMGYHALWNVHAWFMGYRALSNVHAWSD